MSPIGDFLYPNRKRFAADPFGYSALAWDRWTMAVEVSGVTNGPSGQPRGTDLKTPILWLAHAHALSEAATVVVRTEPEFNEMPAMVRGICDGQYCAAGLMLVGYSLEVALKGMLLLRRGVDEYTESEKTVKHHKLVQLAEFIPNLSAKDKAVLECLTEFVIWAGRYPDPGTGRETDLERIFSLSEQHQIAGSDLFDVSTRVMGYLRTMVEEEAS